MSNEKEMKMINQNIKRARRNKNLSQAELAEILKVSRQTVSNWECGISVPDMGMLEKMQKVFEVSPEALLGKETSINEDSGESKLSEQEIVKELAKMNVFYSAEIERRRRLEKIVLIIILLAVITFLVFKMSLYPTKIVISPIYEETESISKP